jgi:hypothetical protein
MFHSWLIRFTLTLLVVFSINLSGTQARNPERQPGSSPAGVANTPFSMPYPRLGMLWPNPWVQPLQEIARYDWVVFPEGAEERAGLVKQISPTLVALTATNACEVSYNPDPGAEPQENAEARAIPAEWFLTQVGTTLTQAVDSSTTTFHVAALTASDGTNTYDLFIPGEAAVIQGESVYIQAVNSTARTLTVQRGYIRPAAAHPAGTRIAAHISFWPRSWVLNLSTLSPQAVVDPLIGLERWGQYHARQDALLMDDPVWDGMLIDHSDPDKSSLIGNSTARTIDPDQSNTLLSDYSAFDASWNTGLRQYLSLLRQAVGETPILYANLGMTNYDLLNGSNFEGFPSDDGTAYGLPWPSAVFGPRENCSYFDWMSNAQQPNLTMIETYEDDSSADPTGGGGYDNPCAEPGFVPNYRKMRFGLTTALLQDGFFSYEINTNGHGALCLLWFDEYDNAGQGRGFLGQPLGPAQRAIAPLTTPNLATGGEMNTQAQLALWRFWADTGYAGSATLDTVNKVVGTGSARLEITQAQGTDWKAIFSFQPAPVTSAADYTLSFWAKADQKRPLTAWVQRASPPWNYWINFPQVTLTTDWQFYEISALASGGDSLARLDFGLGQMTGTVWLDNIQLQRGSREVWRRDFENGIALVNASSYAKTVPLEEIFCKIHGSQAPAVNTGAYVSQVSLPPRDGLILLRTEAPQIFYLPSITK